MRARFTELESDPNKLLATYCVVADDYLFGITRLNAAKIVSNELQIAIHYLSAKRAEGLLGDMDDTPFGSLLEASPFEFDAFLYVTNTSHLVYATTLLDTFVADSTTFLHLLHPASLGPKQPILLEDVLNSASRAEVITRFARKKTKEISYLSLDERISHIEKTFGLKMTIGKDTWEHVDHYISTRNVVVHTQSTHELEFDEIEGVRSTRRRCPVHPRPIADDVFAKAKRAYISLAAEMFRSITHQVLKAQAEQSVQEKLELFAHSIKSTYPYVVAHRQSEAEIEAARAEIEDGQPLSPVADRGRELARQAFRQHIRKTVGQD